MKFVKGYIPWNKEAPIIKKCVVCEKEFTSNPARMRNNKTKYCSYACYWNSKKGSKLSEEHKRKIGVAGKGHPNYLKNHTKEVREKMSRDRKGKQYLRDAGLKGAQVLGLRGPTSIETKVYEELKSRGLLFEKQHLVNGKFLVDAWIPSLNLIIEADGKYWHSLDRVMKKDKAENAYLTKCGFNLLRLSEEEINNGNFIFNITKMKGCD
jgi:very-short-patch-repair endonuclease